MDERDRPEHPVLNTTLLPCLGAHQKSHSQITLIHGLSTPAWVWTNVLSNTECVAIIAATNDLGYGYTAYNKDLRGNLRLICDDPGLANALWLRVRPLLPADLSVDFEGRRWVPTGLNSRFRFAKYYPGDRFSHHCDDCVVWSPNRRSMFTLNIYLNDNRAATRVYLDQTQHEPQDKDVSGYFDCVPLAGSALVFQQLPTAQVLHEGRRVKSGFKYLMRSDIWFEPM